MPSPTPTVPRTLDAIDARWLSDALGHAGIRVRVTQLRAETISAGVGFAGTVARLAVSYDSGSRAAPASLIVKLASGHAPTRQLLASVGAGTREVSYYRTPRVRSFLAPRCYYARSEPDSPWFVLLLEDLAPSVTGDQVLGATKAQSEKVLRTLAGQHARWWCDESLLSQRWLHPPDLAGILIDRFERGRPAFAEVARPVAPDLIRLVDRLANVLAPALGVLETEPIPYPYTLVHGDLRLDNVMLAGPDGGRFALVDWQATTLAGPASDVAYWLITSLTVEERRRTEDDLLRTYLDALRAHGIRYSRRRLRMEYAASAALMVAGAVMLVDQLDFSDERGKALLESSLRRIEAVAADHHVARIVPLLPRLARLGARSAARGHARAARGHVRAPRAHVHRA